MSATFSHLRQFPRHEPRRIRYGEYVRMVNEDFFTDEKIELIDGQIQGMSPISEPHNISVLLCRQAIEAIFGPGHVIRVQMPLGLPPIDSCPEPDLAVVAGSPRDYHTFPTQAILVVEVSVSTLAYDLGAKAALYALGDVPEYWVIDVPTRQVVVHTQPQAGRYRVVQTFGSGQALTPAGQLKCVGVDDLLP